VSRNQASVRWVSRRKTTVRWAVVPANAQATDGLGRCPSAAGSAKRRDRPGERPSEAGSGLGPVRKQSRDREAQGRSAGRRAPLLHAEHDCVAPQGFTACLRNKCSIDVSTAAPSTSPPVSMGLRRPWRYLWDSGPSYLFWLGDRASKENSLRPGPKSVNKRCPSEIRCAQDNHVALAFLAIRDGGNPACTIK
jgi:hypothetical protein